MNIICTHINHVLRFIIQATLKAEIGGQEISTVVSTSELSTTQGQVRII